MGENSAIEWTHHTFNPWIGCTRVSPGCQHCYAETLMADRYGRVKWGPKGDRVRTSPANWRKPLAWNVAAAKAGVRARVFCASLADVFDDHPSIQPVWRDDLWKVIEETPWLDWQLLTKRPENVLDMVPLAWARNGLPPNVWIGTSVEDQRRADERIPHLLNIPAHVRFLSCEPLLGPVDLTRIELVKDTPRRCGIRVNALTGRFVESGLTDADFRLHWVIVGGESGAGARPMHVEWARNIVQQCRDAGVPVFVKQVGKWVAGDHAGFMVDRWLLSDGRVYVPGIIGMWRHNSVPAGAIAFQTFDAKGGHPSQWPEDLRVREFPEVRA